jgi:hypothetical protein
LTGSLVRVLYVVGSGRSGTTLLDNVLGTLPGYFSAGELQMFWAALRQGSGCGCGLPVSDCQVWSQVIARLRQDISWFDPGHVEQLLLEELRIRHTPRLLRLRHDHLYKRPQLAQFAEVLRRVYLAAAEQTGSRVIVDSSKSPATAAILPLLGNTVEPFVVQLVRDPRAVAYSWRSHQPTLDRHRPGEMHRSTALKSALRWTTTNVLAEMVRTRLGKNRSLVVRYEDFTRDPRATLESIARLLGDDDIGLPFTEDGTIGLETNHTVWGNRSRFVTGPVTLRVDQRWEKHLPASVNAGVTALTLPGLLRYRYVRPIPRRP